MPRVPLFIPLDKSKLRGRVLGKCYAHQLREGQEFRTLLSRKDGYVLGIEKRRRHGKILGAVRVLLDGPDPVELEERNLHPMVMVEAL